MPRMPRHRALRLAFGIVLACYQANPALADCPAVPALGDGWATGAPAQHDLDPAILCTIHARLATLPGASPNAVVLIRDGVLVYETYFAGNDARWPQQHWGRPPVAMPHDAHTGHDLQGITGSVVALLAGIAIDRGALDSVDAPLFRFFPGYADLDASDRNRITLRDLLTMTSGLDWPPKPFMEMQHRMAVAPDPYRFVLAQPLADTPGLQFRYNGGSAELAGAVVQQATGQRLDEFAKQTLFDPLGITHWQWGRLTNGNPAASWGLRLRPRDLAKIGQLVLDNGSWQGRQVVSAAWVKAMIAPQVSAVLGSYGYLWGIGWAQPLTVNHARIAIVTARGWGGQRLFVIPSLDMVLVVAAGDYDFSGNDFEPAAAYMARDIALGAALQAAGRWTGVRAPGHPVIVRTITRRP